MRNCEGKEEEEEKVGNKIESITNSSYVLEKTVNWRVFGGVEVA
jgi:hypothetical protein